YETRNEQRSASFYDLTVALIDNVPAPDEKQLEAWYKDHKADFTAPEYRTLSYATLSTADIHNVPQVSQDDLRAMYKERLDEFKYPERRSVEQLLYDDEAKANKAEALLKDGKDFMQVAKQAEPVNKDAFELGKVARNALPGAAADTVFSL